MSAERLRQAIGSTGVFSPQFVVGGLDEVEEALARLEQLGYAAVWYPEIPTGRESMTAAAALLAVSDRIVVGSGIASIWARDGVAAANAARTLNESFGGRFVLGLGVSHQPAVAMRGWISYEKPYLAMRAYLETMAAADATAGGERPPRLLGALAPRMLELAREHADGTLTYFCPAEHTAVARDALGAAPVVAVELAVVLETDAERARAIARRYSSFYLAAPNYRNVLLALGWAEADLDGGGSDDLVDRIVAWGDAGAIRERVAEHRAAGADHVAIQVLTERTRTFEPEPFPLDELAALAP